MLEADLSGQAVAFLVDNVFYTRPPSPCQSEQTEVTAQDAKLSSLRQRRKPIRKSCRVGIMEVPVEVCSCCAKSGRYPEA